MAFLGRDKGGALYVILPWGRDKGGALYDLFPDWLVVYSPLIGRCLFLSQVDDDFTVQDFRLQYRRHRSGHFEDAYVGPECDFIVLHIDPNVDYEFRVCARGDGRQEWSPWSVPQLGHTSLIPHGKSCLFLYWSCELTIYGKGIL